MAEKCVLITGASSGIGFASAAHLAAGGVLVLAGVRRPEDGERLSRQGTGLIRPVILDVTEEDSIQAAAEAARTMLPDGLDGLVNNAGIAVGGPMELVPMERVRRQFDVNLFGLVRVTQTFLPWLRRARGRIVNIGSVSGLSTSPLFGPYCASKYALEAVTDALRMELNRWGISVSVIEPGPVATPIWDKGRRDAVAAPEEESRLMELYADEFEAVKRMVQYAERVAVPPERVAEKVEHALLSSRPRTRYLVGPRGVGLQLKLERWLPDRWRDWVVRRLMGLR